MFKFKEYEGILFLLKSYINSHMSESITKANRSNIHSLAGVF